MLQALPLPSRPADSRPKPKLPRPYQRAAALHERYLQLACRPLLALPESVRPVLAQHVRTHAVAAYDARLRFVAALAELGEPSDEPSQTGKQATGASADAQTLERARTVFVPDFAECLGLALRVVRRTTARLRACGEGLDSRLAQHPETAERVGLVVQWLDVVLHAASWFLDDPAPWMQRGVAEEACFLAKEWALDFAAFVEALFADRARPTEPVESRLSAAHAAFDREFAEWATALVGDSLRS